jgi:hypothetical protein
MGTAGGLAATARAAVRSGCPPATARFSLIAPATADLVIAAARSQVIGTFTHYQGRTERRTKQNTPVEAVVMDLGFSSLTGSQPLLRQARRRCGSHVAEASSAVLFHDGLSVIANATIMKFVVKTGRGVWVYGA